MVKILFDQTDRSQQKSMEAISVCHKIKLDSFRKQYFSIDVKSRANIYP